MSAITQQQFKDAPIKESAFYSTLINPIFEGQTRVQEDGTYKMYFTSNNKLYGFNHTL